MQQDNNQELMKNALYHWLNRGKAVPAQASTITFSF
jgi:hypothetical protein